MEFQRLTHMGGKPHPALRPCGVPLEEHQGQAGGPPHPPGVLRDPHFPNGVLRDRRKWRGTAAAPRAI